MKAAWLIVALAALVLAPAATAEPLSPLIVDWDQYLRIETESAVRDGHVVVSGTIVNFSSWSAKRIQLLVEELDASGEPAAQRVIWLGVDLGSGMHAFFETKVKPAASYRVRVFAFDSRRGRWG